MPVGGELGCGEGAHLGGICADECGGVHLLTESLQGAGGHQESVLHGADRLVVGGDAAPQRHTDGVEVTGWPVGTIVRGQRVMWEGEVATPSRGEVARFAEALQA